MNLNNESMTLFIPIFGKAKMSEKSLFIKDKKAEEIIKNIEYDFSKLKQSKWLSMYMALRARIIDDICNEAFKKNSNVTVIHLGCGLDSRVFRVSQKYNMWYDIDFKNVIDLRKKFYNESPKYKMIGKDVTDLSWLEDIMVDSNNILIVAEGLTMYLSEEDLKNVINAIGKKFRNSTLIFDSYTNRAVKASKYKNPVNQMNASIKWGMNNKGDFLKLNDNLQFEKEYLIKNVENNLKGITKVIFEKVYCGKISEKLYKIYKFRLKK